jgi:ATP-dependent Clp protease ATP-binding subunit ClpC
MFERYTESARRALFFARWEASQLGSLSIEAEHLLLGLLRNGGLDKVLTIPLAPIRRELEGHVVSEKKIPNSAEMPFSIETKRVMELTAQEADSLGHAHIGSEHLLLGLLREEHSVAYRTLTAHGVRLDDVRREVAALRGPLDGSPQSVARFELKMLVEELARTPRGTREADELVRQIIAGLDDLAT